MRTSESEKIGVGTTLTPISNSVLQDVNTTMDSVRVEMSKSLAQECERLGGYWIATQYKENGTGGSNIDIHKRFYNETGANKNWGYCADPTEAQKYYQQGQKTNSGADTENAGS
jgi:hypothetical protein